MNEQTKKRILVISGFLTVILAMIIYSAVMFGSDGGSEALGEFNPTFKTPELPSKVLNKEYTSKLEAYKEEREQGRGVRTEKPIVVPFEGEIMKDTSLMTKEQQQQYVIDSLTNALQNANTHPPQVSYRSSDKRSVDSKLIQSPEKEKDPFEGFELNRASNPLETTNNTESGSPYDYNKYYDGKFIEDQVLVIGSDQSINLRNTESITLRNGTTIPRNTVMKGIISKIGNRLLIRVNQVQTFDGNWPVQLVVYHNDFQEGLPLQSEDPMASQNREKLEDVVNQASSQIKANIPFSSVPITMGPKIGNTQLEKIHIPASMTFKLRVLHQ